MRTITWAVVVVAGLGLAVPVWSDDPAPASGSEASTEQTAKSESAPSPGDASGSTIQVEEIRTGAGSMEPSQGETREERNERLFVENVWTSP